MTPRQDAHGAANSSSWNESGHAFAPNTNTLDAQTMPSDKAAAARAKSAKVMAALKSGEPGAADQAMGRSEGSAYGGVTPLGGWLDKMRAKIKGGKAGKGKKGGVDGVESKGGESNRVVR